MSQRFAKVRGLFARLSKIFNRRLHVPIPSNALEFYAACKELAFWSASDAGLDGPVETFDGSMLHPAADGMCTIRMTLKDSKENRPPAEAAATILRSLGALRVLLLLEIDGSRFVNLPQNINPGVHELGRNFTDRTERAG